MPLSTWFTEGGFCMSHRTFVAALLLVAGCGLGHDAPAPLADAAARASTASSPLGEVINRSTRNVMIVGADARWCLRPGESSDEVLGLLGDADGVLLDGTPVLILPNDPAVAGGGQVHRTGAVKVCTGGSLTLENMPGPVAQISATISRIGYTACRANDPAGHRTKRWVETNWNHAVKRQC